MDLHITLGDSGSNFDDVSCGFKKKSRSLSSDVFINLNVSEL